ncbi:hypothetical protein GJ496_004880 [Pomphorhynchus laevis]|nr:hypothetical protein GJ496_004880 [Pomphorhynchus laevis]
MSHYVKGSTQFGFSSNVWVPDNESAFLRAKIIDIGSDQIKVELLNDTSNTSLLSRGKPIVKSFDYDLIYPAENEGHKDVDDNCALMFLNQATVLYNIKRRYMKDVIYTYVANILIAINPYKHIPNLYDSNLMQKHNGRSLGSLEPHLFAIGDKAYREMKHMRIDQSIIVSGESGSGKTETVKYILTYLTTSYGHKSGIIEERLMDSNPLLEAFGNAKTTRNNNSSRFGKFIELHFSKGFNISGGYISHYLLERTRVCKQSRGERNYHIFYQLCCAADPQLRAKLKLTSPDNFNILRGCTQYFLRRENENLVDSSVKSSDHRKQGPLYDIQLDDRDAFQHCLRAMKNMSMSDEDCKNVFSTVAAIMHLGNVKFEQDTSNKSGGCVVNSSSKLSLETAASLLSVPVEDLHYAIVNRTMRPKTVGRRPGSMIFVPLKIEDAMHVRDALCKTIYVRLFDYLVKTVNISIPPSDNSAHYIGMLDIAGFEYFPINSFEQFCINYCNERLQQFFNSRILRDEQDIYEREGLGVRHIEYVDNQDCIDLIEGRNTGILEILDEENKLPQPHFTHFTLEVFKKNKNHLRLDLPRKSHLKLYREIRDDEGFLVRHFAGAVVYSTAEFIDKNNDAIHASLLMAVQEGTQSDFLRNLFEHHGDQTMDEGKLNFISVGSKFKSQLNGLLERLYNTGTSFVRCIKPNEHMKPSEFDGPHILTQLQCAGMLSVLELMQQGFPSRAKFSVIYGLYEKLLPIDLARLDPRFFCKGLFHCLNMSSIDYRFGTTMVFFRPGKFAEFDALMREDPDHRKLLITKVRRWLIKARWRKAQYFIWSYIRFSNCMKARKQKIILIQSVARMYIQTQRHHFRIQGLSKLASFMKLLQQVKADNLLANGELNKIYNELATQGQRLRELLHGRHQELQTSITPDWVNSSLSTMSTKIENLLTTANEANISYRKQQDEEKLKRIKLELKEQEEKKRIAEKIKQDSENESRKRKEIEERRRKEEHKHLKMQDELARAAAEDAKRQKERLIQRKNQEQMRIDYHLAQKLASDCGSDIDPLSIIGLPHDQARLSKENVAKYNLTSWKYAQLRDTINTSCELELLQACREEFHRRLKAYHTWKSRNKAKGAPVDRRVPVEIIEAIKNMRAIVGSETVVENEQRFFRVIVNDCVDGVGNNYDNNSKSGAGNIRLTKPESSWYAHFDGKWICRQVEVIEGKPKRPMIAGIDDMDMCELSLDETDLTYRKGVEILESEFEKVWNLCGGLQYMAENYTRISSKYLQDKARPLVDMIEF